MQSNLEFSHECILLVLLLCFKSSKFSLHVGSKYRYFCIYIITHLENIQSTSKRRWSTGYHYCQALFKGIPNYQNIDYCRVVSVSKRSEANKCGQFETLHCIYTYVWPLFQPVNGKVGYLTSRTHFHPVCSHLRMKLFVRRMQELLLPEQAAVACVVSGLCASHKWRLEFIRAC